MGSHLFAPIGTQLLLSRPRLEELSGRAMAARVTVITAGAGFGKTTLLDRWAEPTRAAQMTLTSADRSLVGLARRLVDALRLRVPGIGSTVLADLDTGGGDYDAGIDRAANHAAFLADALDRHLTRPLLLILDGLHELEGSEAASLVEALVRQAPSHLPIVLSGRIDPTIRLARMRSRGEVFDLGPNDLAFTREETGELASRILGPGNLDSAGKRVFAVAGGWPAATRLALEALREAPFQRAGDLLGKAPAPGGRLFEYLAEEVLNSIGPEDRLLLGQLNVLGTVSSALCQALDLADAARLQSLLRHGVFLEESDAGVALRSLVAGFLSSQGLMSEEDASRLHQTAAAWYAGLHDAVPALRHALASGDDQFLGSHLEALGDRALTTGGALVVLEACLALPASMRTVHVNRLMGEAQLASGDWEGALSTFQVTAGKEALIDPGLAWRMGLNLHLRGELTEAVITYRRGDLNSGGVEDQALLLGWWAGALWLTGDVEECGRLAEEAVTRAGLAGSDRAMAAALTVKAMLAAVGGDRRSNEILYLSALEHAQRADDVLQLIRIHVNRGSRHLEEGSYEEAIAETELALPLADLAGYNSLRALGINNRGQARMHLGRFEEAIADFRESHDLWQRVSARQVAYALTATGEIHRLRGDRNLARLSYEEACGVAEPVADVQALVPALAGLARVLAEDEPSLALELATRARDAGPMLGHAQALLATAEVHLAGGELETAGQVAETALSFARGRRDPAAMAEALELLAASGSDPEGRLSEAIAIWDSLGNPLGTARAGLRLAGRIGGDEPEVLQLRSALRRLGARRLADEADRLLDELRLQSRPDVSIGVLGGFRVLIGGKPLSATAWQSKKARDIVKMLIARRGKPLHREVLIDQLWPDDDSSKAGSRLSVALSVIRGVLDPAKALAPDHHLEADRETISLRVDHLEIDLEAFHDAAAAGLAAARRGDADRATALLEQAEAAYAGDLFEEDPYEDWALPAREEARATYVSVANWLAERSSSQGDHDAAVRYLLRILQRDPFDENAHLRLVRVMIEARRHGEARRLYRQYCSRMEELGIEAARYP